MDSIATFIDGSTYAASLCDHAAWAAGRVGAPVVLVHALGRPDSSSAPADLSGNLQLGARRSLLEKLAQHDRERAALAVERGRAILDDGRARMMATADIEVTTRLRRSDPVEALTEMMETTRFALIGKRGEDASGQMAHLGSNLERLVRASTRPVMVVNRAFRPIARFLIAYDGSPSATRAVERVCESPLLKGAEAHILTASADAGKLTQAAGQLRGAGFTVHEHAIGGPPEEVIAAAVRDHDIGLLVLGKSGHSRLRQLFIGSTTLDLMRSCQVPVLIFP